MKKVLLLLSLVLVLGSCNLFKKKPKFHDDSSPGKAAATTSEKNKDSEAMDYEQASAEASRHYYGDSYGKNAEIEQWLSVVARRHLTEEDIEGLPIEDLTLIRNLIYANHNYVFQQSRFRHFFSQYDWYEPIYEDAGYVSSLLNSNEQYNVNFLLRHEGK